MISGGQINNDDKSVSEKQTDIDNPSENPEKSKRKLTPEEAEKAKKAAALVIQELMKTEGKKRTPKFLWYFSGCILLVIIVIIASFLIPLLSMVSDAKDVVRQHLTYLQSNELEKAFELCDADILGTEYIYNLILKADDSIKINGISDEFREFSKKLMRDKFTEKNMKTFLNTLSDNKIHEAVELCDIEYYAKLSHDEKAKIFQERLDKSPFEVQKFSTVEKPPAVRGQFINNGEYFTYNVFSDDTMKISNFRLGFPKKTDE